MKPKNNMLPVHPGEILNNDLELMGLDVESFAENLGIPVSQMEELLAGTRDLDADLALRLDRYFGSGARMWMNLQTAYSLKVAEKESGDRIENEVTPRRSKPNPKVSDAALVDAA